MATKVRQLRVPEGLVREIGQEAERRGQEWAETATEILEEAIRIRRVPGIIFTDGAAGRRATIAGSGLDVWEVIRTWKEDVDRDYDELRKVYNWLLEPQLKAALKYYELYPEEIDERHRVEESWTPERLYAEHPFARPPWL